MKVRTIRLNSAKVGDGYYDLLKKYPKLKKILISSEYSKDFKIYYRAKVNIKTIDDLLLLIECVENKDIIISDRYTKPFEITIYDDYLE